MGEELLIVKKDKDRLKFKVVNKNTKTWTPSKYEKIIPNRDYNLIAYLLYDLHSMGYPVDKSYTKFRDMLNDPELFFL